MAFMTRFLPLAAMWIAAAALRSQTPKPESLSAFGCYVQSAESRMAARRTFLLVDADPSRLTAVVREKKIVITPGSAANPHKIPNAMIFDFVGSVFIPGATVR